MTEQESFSRTAVLLIVQAFNEAVHGIGHTEPIKYLLPVVPTRL